MPWGGASLWILSQLLVSSASMPSSIWFQLLAPGVTHCWAEIVWRAGKGSWWWNVVLAPGSAQRGLFGQLILHLTTVSKGKTSIPYIPHVGRRASHSFQPGSINNCSDMARGASVQASQQWLKVFGLTDEWSPCMFSHVTLDGLGQLWVSLTVLPITFIHWVGQKSMWCSSGEYEVAFCYFCTLVSELPWQ